MTKHVRVRRDDDVGVPREVACVVRKLKLSIACGCAGVLSLVCLKRVKRVILLHRSPLLRATLLIIDTPRFIRDRWGDIKEVGKSQERTNPSFGGVRWGGTPPPVTACCLLFITLYCSEDKRYTLTAPGVGCQVVSQKEGIVTRSCRRRRHHVDPHARRAGAPATVRFRVIGR